MGGLRNRCHLGCIRFFFVGKPIQPRGLRFVILAMRCKSSPFDYDTCGEKDEEIDVSRALAGSSFILLTFDSIMDGSVKFSVFRLPRGISMVS